MTDSRSKADQAKKRMIDDAVIDPMTRAGEAMKASGEKAAEGSAQVGLKVLDQAEQNAREAFAAMRAAASAKDLSQVMKIQGDYLRDQSNRNLAQAKEIGEMILRFGRESAAPLRGDNG